MVSNATKAQIHADDMTIKQPSFLLNYDRLHVKHLQILNKIHIDLVLLLYVWFLLEFLFRLVSLTLIAVIFILLFRVFRNNDQKAVDYVGSLFRVMFDLFGLDLVFFSSNVWEL